MNPDKDYYRILGVLDDAEDVVIKAAYRALAQRYHPDKWRGDPAEATKRMSELNTAYGILSDRAKRTAYDSKRDKTQFGANDSGATQDEDTSDVLAVNKDWAIAKKYHPEVGEAERQLNAMSHALGFTFKLTLLESKRFSDYEPVARELEKKFLAKYFGNEREGQQFAKELILEGRRDAAKELNEAVRVLGNISPSVIERISREFKTARYRKSPKDREDASRREELANKIIEWLQCRGYPNELVVSYVSKYSETYSRSIRAQIRRGGGFLDLGSTVEFFLVEGSVKTALSDSQAAEWFLNDRR